MSIKEYLRRFFCVILVLVLLIQCCPFTVYADSKKEVVFVTISSGNNVERYEAIQDGDELFLPLEDYQKITRYSLIERPEGDFGLTLGNKALIFMPGKKEFQLITNGNVNNVSYSGMMEKEGVHYLPMSEILPWLNTEVECKGGNLVINNDPISFWEVSTFDYDLLNVTNGLDLNDEWTAVGLVALNVFDSIVNTRWDKFITMKGVDDRYDNTDLLFDYNRHSECLLSLAEDDTLYSSKVDSVLKKMGNVGKNAENLEEILGINDHTKSEISDFLFELRESTDYYDINSTGSDLYDLWTKFDEYWADIKAVGEAAGTASDIMKVLKNVEIVMSASPDYLRAIDYLAKNTPETNYLLKMTAQETEQHMKDATGGILGGIIDMEKGNLEKTVIEELGIDGIFPELGAIKAVKAGLMLVWPSGVKAVEGVANEPAYQNIMTTSKNFSYQILNDGLDYDSVNNSRTLMILTYKAAKESTKSYSILLKAFGGEGLLQNRVDSIEEEIVKLALCEDTMLHDSMDGKDEATNNIKQLIPSLLVLHDITDSFSKEELLYMQTIISPFRFFGGDISDAYKSEIISAVTDLADSSDYVAGTKDIIPCKRVRIDEDIYGYLGEYDKENKYTQGEWIVVDTGVLCEAAQYIFNYKITPTDIVLASYGDMFFMTAKELMDNTITDYGVVDTDVLLCEGRRGFSNIEISRVISDDNYLYAEYKFGYLDNDFQKKGFVAKLARNDSDKYPFSLISEYGMSGNTIENTIIDSDSIRLTQRNSFGGDVPGVHEIYADNLGVAIDICWGNDYKVDGYEVEYQIEYWTWDSRNPYEWGEKRLETVETKHLPVYWCNAYAGYDFTGVNVRVRPYKITDGDRKYGPWSKEKYLELNESIAILWPAIEKAYDYLDL